MSGLLGAPRTTTGNTAHLVTCARSPGNLVTVTYTRPLKASNMCAPFTLGTQPTYASLVTLITLPQEALGKLKLKVNLISLSGKPDRHGHVIWHAW